MRGWLIAAAAAFGITAVSACSSSDEGASAQAGEETLPLEVKITDGSVRGTTIDESGVRVFRAIPYAAPPTGANRWRKPQPVAPWSDVRDATQMGKRCPQPTFTGAVATDGTDEDCLTLDVLTPVKKKKAGETMPVMVWIHGGAFTLGSNRDAISEPTKLVAATGAMIVAINYRLGALGFLAHPALAGDGEGSHGNFGLWDQRAALQWVQRNAAAFGGDPGKVTIFGESAGGQSVALLTTSPVVAKEGLFHRAIIQSGAAGSVTLAGLDVAEKEANDLAKVVGCAAGDFACLRAKPANDLVAALKHTAASQPVGGLLQGSVGVKPWLPVADDILVPKRPLESFKNGAAAKVPYIIGSTREEGRIFHAGLLGDKKLGPSDDYAGVLKKMFGDEAGARVADRYPPSAFGGDPNAALARITTLVAFVCTSRTTARAARDAGNPTYLYSLGRTPNGGLAAGLGSAHAVDLVFLFDTDTGAGGRAGDEARDLVAGMQGYWGSFAESGAPQHEGSPAWPSFAADEKHLSLDVPLSVGEAHEKDDCDFWDTVPQPQLPAFYPPP